MKKLAILILLAILSAAPRFDGPENFLSSERSIGIFSPFSINLQNNVQVQTHALSNFVCPNMSVQKLHGQFRGTQFSSAHSLLYPTPLLRLLQREGTGGVLSPDPDAGEFPHGIIFQSRFIIAKRFEIQSLAADIGFRIWLGEAGDERLSIDYPPIYPYMLTIFHNPGLRTGLHYGRQLSTKTNLYSHLDSFWSPRSDFSPQLEIRNQIDFRLSSDRAFRVGFVLTHGDYPWGDQWFIYPILDFIWKWNKR